MIIIVATITLTTVVDANAISGENKRKIKELSDVPRYIKRFANVGDMPTERDLNYIGRKYDLPDGLLYAMFWKETHYKCNVKSSANAYGCFQFQYWSAKEVNLIGKIGKRDYDYRTNPWIAADAAARYLKIIQYKLNLANSKDPHSIALMLAGYNAGIGKIRRDGNKLNPPMYTETQYYIEDILGYVEGNRHIGQRG